MFRTVRSHWVGLALAAIVGSSGCGQGGRERPRLPVSGTVTLDWKPLASGVIRFRPVTPGLATSAEATIENGQFSIPRDQGLVPGTYTVTVSRTLSAISDPDPQGPSSRSGNSPPNDRLPGNLNTNIQTEVREGADNVFSYDFKTTT